MSTQTTRTEWGVRWNDGDLDDYGFGEDGRTTAEDAIRVEPMYAGQLVCRVHTIGEWAEPEVAS